MRLVVAVHGFPRPSSTHSSASRRRSTSSPPAERGFQWYEQHFATAGGCAAIGEISPLRARRTGMPRPGPGRIILICVSSSHFGTPSNAPIRITCTTSGSGYDVNDDLTFEAALMNNPMYLEQSRYAKHVERWLEFFPKERVLIVLQEDIRADPQIEARRVYEFLGIGTEHVSDFVGRRANESYLPRSRGRSGSSAPPGPSRAGSDSEGWTGCCDVRAWSQPSNAEIGWRSVMWSRHCAPKHVCGCTSFSPTIHFASRRLWNARARLGRYRRTRPPPVWRGDTTTDPHDVLSEGNVSHGSGATDDAIRSRTAWSRPFDRSRHAVRRPVRQGWTA